jgi:hypothetical protein
MRGSCGSAILASCGSILQQHHGGIYHVGPLNRGCGNGLIVLLRAKWQRGKALHWFVIRPIVCMSFGLCKL